MDPTTKITFQSEPGLTPDEFIDVLRRSTLAERRPVDEPDRPSPVALEYPTRNSKHWVRVVPSPVDPPGPEPQRMQQLRVDVLLI